MIGVYAIRNLQTGKVYIGASADVQRRLSAHTRDLDAGRHKLPDLQADWAAVGGDAFSFELLEVLDSAGDLRQREQWQIEQAREQGETYNALRSTPYGSRRVTDPTADHDLLRLSEVAARLATNAETVRRWIRAGKIKALSTGSDAGGYRVRTSEVARLLAEMEGQPSAE